MDDKYKQQSKERLLKISSKKLLTLGISALSAFEEHILKNPLFDSVLDDLLIVYESTVRKIVLDAVNRQSKNLLSEFQDYEIEWLRHRIVFEVKEKSE